MKLLYRALIFYSIAAFVLFSIMGIVLYTSIRYSILKQVSNTLLTEKQIIEEEIFQTDSLPDFSSIFNHEIEVSVYKHRLSPSLNFIDSMITDSVHEGMTEYRFLKYAGNTPDGRGFIIKTSQSIQEEKDLVYEIFTIILTVLAVLLLILIIAVYSISKNTWSDFYHILSNIRQFDIKTESRFEPVATQIHEFAQLNDVLESLTRKIRSDYQNLKEVTENVSHEIQTPVSVIRVKIDQLLQSKAITDKLASELYAINQSVSKISRINQAITLMSKIDNNQYPVAGKINLNQKIHQLIEQFSDFIESKKLEVSIDQHEEANISMNEDLAGFLFTNLLGNAIKHNFENGSIEISIHHDRFMIRNTGPDPQTRTEFLFQRFRKADQSSESAGLGLSIVKKVIDFYNLKIEYRFEAPFHTVTIFF
ncbi:MAG TPA: HAMP domain-containing sensor histidine kinase [Bacteroidales bacterium]|nr:HAMP domain-containing sensor histidine kinase [Bacteroidales bacterium]